MSNWLSGLMAIPTSKPLRGHAQKVADALRSGPMTTAQLIAATGLTTVQVREVFRKHLGEVFVSRPVVYSLKPTNVGEVAHDEK